MHLRSFFNPSPSLTPPLKIQTRFPQTPVNNNLLFSISLAMAYGRRDPSIFDTFTLSPLPYPVLFILLTVFVLLAISWSFNYEDLLESAEEQMSLVLLLTPLALLLLIRLLASADSLFDGSGLLGFVLPYDRRNRRRFYESALAEDGGSASPWGVAVAVVVLIILASFRSSFEDMWKP